jgi:tryptophanyl-tRNA synthetase
MAADILIHQSHLVPVGQDQKQHVEVCRDIAERFNGIYGELFRLPEPYILGESAIVPGTDGRKMSKSYGNTLGLFEPEKSLKSKIMSIQTDSTPVEAPKDPDKCKLFALVSLLASADEKAEIERRYRAGGIGYGEVKKRLLALMLEYFREARERRRELEGDMTTVQKALDRGAEKARASARPTLQAARAAVGL